MDYLLAVLAGAVQGLTEFLPVSSTGHLIIFENLFGISQQKFGLAFDASLHLGTLIAIISFFAKDYLKFRKSLGPKIIVATAPAVFLGLLFENFIETTARQLWIVGASLILFSFVFILAEKIGQKNKPGKQPSYLESLVIGMFQALALIPGISRSGSTISAGLLIGVKRDEAARFAFMLSGPIVAGAGLKKFLEVVGQRGITNNDFNFFIIGIISATFFGYLTIKYFLKYLSTKTLHPFVIYRIVIGIILILYGTEIGRS